MFNFYTPLKRQKAFDFLMFSGSIVVENWAKMVEWIGWVQSMNSKHKLTEFYHSQNVSKTYILRLMLQNYFVPKMFF